METRIVCAHLTRDYLGASAASVVRNTSADDPVWMQIAPTRAGLFMYSPTIATCIVVARLPVVKRETPHAVIRKYY